jgi:hypothetical protein
MKITRRQLRRLVQEQVDLAPDAMTRIKSAIKRTLGDEGGASDITAIVQAVNDAEGDDVNIDVEKFIEDEMSSEVTRHASGDYVEKTGLSESILARSEIRRLVLEEIKMLSDGKKASKTKGKPYKGSRRGKTESQAQQMAAGIALSAVDKYGKKGAIRRLSGAPKAMAQMKYKDLKNLATIRRGSEVPAKTKKGHERAALPGHIKKGK